MHHIDCHEEKIHLCGTIQDFGYLFVFNAAAMCIACSENTSELEDLLPGGSIGTHIDVLLHMLTGGESLPLAEIDRQLSELIFYRFVERVRLLGKDFDYSVYRHDDRIFLEIEVCNPSSIKPTRLYYYAKFLEDNDNNIWQPLTALVRDVIEYDRVVVYRFHEDKSGQVVAESVAPGMDTLMGYRYPEFDIPKQARALYLRFLARHTSDTESPVFRLIGEDVYGIDLSRCSLRALAPVHLQYLRNAGVQASASFSIIIDGRLWGLVACHNRTAKHADLAQRHLCTFLTQYAVNKYLSAQHKEELVSYATVSTLERELKTELLVNKDIYVALENFAPQILEMTGADGLLIRHDKGENTWGLVPSGKQVAAIDEFLSLHRTEHAYATHQFDYSKLKEQDKDIVHNLPGVIRVNILPDSAYYLYLFRKEYELEEIWAGKPEKHMQYDSNIKRSFASPRHSFRAWTQIIKGKAVPWKKSEIAFVDRIAYITQQAVVRRTGEIQALNKELIRSNNALDTFGYTLNHDLKNPLTSIKVAAQVIHQKENIPVAYLKKLSNNIMEAADLVIEMVDKVHQLAKSNSVTFERELINPRKKIVAIAASCQEQFRVKNLNFILGKTFPVNGERTLLYQLFLNLIGNAIKYSSRESAPEVAVYSTQYDNIVSYFIRDNGIGMELDADSNIFDIFKRLPNSSGFEGSGIGLSIVKRICDRLGAVIDVQSTPGAGTVFRVDFDNSSAVQI